MGRQPLSEMKRSVIELAARSLSRK